MRPTLPGNLLSAFRHPDSTKLFSPSPRDENEGQNQTGILCYLNPQEGDSSALLLTFIIFKAPVEFTVMAKGGPREGGRKIRGV